MREKVSALLAVSSIDVSGDPRSVSSLLPLKTYGKKRLIVTFEREWGREGMGDRWQRIARGRDMGMGEEAKA